MVLHSSLFSVGFWIAEIHSARIQEEEYTVSRRCSARTSRRQNVALNQPIFTRWPAPHPDRLQLFSPRLPWG